MNAFIDENDRLKMMVDISERDNCHLVELVGNLEKENERLKSRVHELEAIIHYENFELYEEKPQACPFCGSDQTTWDDSWTYWCFCSNINCSLIGPKRPTKELAIEAWNKIKVEK